MSEQFRQVVASQGTGARMEWLDSDFRYVAGGVFAATIDNLDFDEAALAYSYAPESLQKYAYDMLAEKFREEIDTASREQGGRPFDEYFPEPEGMAAFRDYLRAKDRELRRNDLDAINVR